MGGSSNVGGGLLIFQLIFVSTDVLKYICTSTLYCSTFVL